MSDKQLKILKKHFQIDNETNLPKNYTFPLHFCNNENNIFYRLDVQNNDNQIHFLFTVSFNDLNGISDDLVDNFFKSTYSIEGIENLQCKDEMDKFYNVTCDRIIWMMKFGHCQCNKFKFGNNPICINCQFNYDLTDDICLICHEPIWNSPQHSSFSSCCNAKSHKKCLDESSFKNKCLICKKNQKFSYESDSDGDQIIAHSSFFDQP